VPDVNIGASCAAAARKQAPGKRTQRHCLYGCLRLCDGGEFVNGHEPRGEGGYNGPMRREAATADETA
jgi:hypothetical protein